MRRFTWLLHNTLMTPFIPIRLLLLILIKIGEAAERVGMHTPGWRMYDGWSFGSPNISTTKHTQGEG